MTALAGGGATPRCAVPGCAIPYVLPHPIDGEEPVFLCLGHAEQAVHAAAPPDRLRALRLAGPGAPDRVTWQRRKVVTRVAGNFFYETPVVFRLGSMTCVGLGRDDDGNVALELRMPTASGQRRARIAGNVWEAPAGSSTSPTPRATGSGSSSSTSTPPGPSRCASATWPAGPTASTTR